MTLCIRAESGFYVVRKGVVNHFRSLDGNRAAAVISLRAPAKWRLTAQECRRRGEEDV